MQLADALEVRIVLRKDDMRHIELRDGKPVFREAGQELLSQRGRDIIDVLINLQKVDLTVPDDSGQRGLDGVHDQRTEGLAHGLCKAVPVIPRDTALCADELQQQAARIRDLKIHLPGHAQLKRCARERVDEAELVGRAPLDGHLHRLVDKVDLGMECALGVGRELIETLKQRQLLCLQRIASRTEEVESLTVAEEDSLLTFVDDELRAVIEVLDRVLPDERLIIALEFDDAGKPVLLDLLGDDALLHIIDAVTHRAGVFFRAAVGKQTHAALRAGKFYHSVPLGGSVYCLAADGADGFVTLGLVKDNVVTAVRAAAACHLIRAYVYRVPARAVDFLACKEPGLCLGIFPA